MREARRLRGMYPPSDDELGGRGRGRSVGACGGCIPQQTPSSGWTVSRRSSRTVRREAEAARREVEVARREMEAMRKESDVAARAAAPCGAAGRVRAQPPVRLMPPAPVTRVKLTRGARIPAPAVPPSHDKATRVTPRAPRAPRALLTGVGLCRSDFASVALSSPAPPPLSSAPPPLSSPPPPPSSLPPPLSSLPPPLSSPPRRLSSPRVAALAHLSAAVGDNLRSTLAPLLAAVGDNPRRPRRRRSPLLARRPRRALHDAPSPFHAALAAASGDNPSISCRASPAHPLSPRTTRQRPRRRPPSPPASRCLG